MWVQVRTMDGKRSEQVDGISKLTKIKDLREIIEEKFGVASTSQRLYFRGKQMEDGYSLFDYDVGLNDIIQLLERKSFASQMESPEKEKQDISSDSDSGIDAREHSPDRVTIANESQEVASVSHDKEDVNMFQVNDLVDAQDIATGAWFEAKILSISKDNSIQYDIVFEDYDEGKTLSQDFVRPRARKLLEWDHINIGDKVMVNYNLDKPNERGFWYDCFILNKLTRRRFKELDVELLLGSDKTISPCKIILVEEVFAIEKLGMESSPVTEENAVKRNTEKDPYCAHCGDNPRRNCKECGCHVCGQKRDYDKTLLCDECNLPFHTFCLNPPLDQLPEEDEWYCPLCQNDRSEVVNPGEKLKESKKKAKMKSFATESERDWGKGMACVGRSKICTIVPPNHCGPIPGVPVGTLWKFRVQVSEAGVHRPHVSGIHGKEGDTAYSIVLAGGYEDDEDNGDQFTYTGSGGRDLSGNKRTAEQSCDQVLTKSNMAIARSCNAKVDAKNGAEAIDWRKSRPIRVVRNYKGAKHSKYAPKEGNRYDGIYKVVKYWPEKGKSGFVVWRYLFRRDDKELAPWTSKGKKKMQELGITMQYPDGYLEAQKNAFVTEEDKGGKKRKRESSSEGNKKKRKVLAYQVPSDISTLIRSDKENDKVWQEGLACAADGQQAFYQKLQSLFACVCCQDLVYQPVTTSCKHNMCKDCLQRSFKAEVYSCPVCRAELGRNYKMEMNQILQKILAKIFPGYESGR